MNIKHLSTLILVLGMTLTNCHQPGKMSNANLEENGQLSTIFHSPNGYHHNGKRKSADVQDDLYVQQAISVDHFPTIDAGTQTALEQQFKLLKRKKRKKPQQVGNLTISNEQLRQTVEILLDGNNDAMSLSHQLNAYKIKGRDRRGHVHFTGYYTPVLNVSRTKNERFQYPIYAYPQDWEGKLPARADIDGDKQAFFGHGLELAYAENLMDIYMMQVQGSGIVQYRDGKKELFAFAGSNRKKYKSIGRYMVKNGLTTEEHMSLPYIKKYLKAHPEKAAEILFSNPSYVFFHPVNSNPKGAGLVPLTEMQSIAVDTRYIPMGSILLAKVPVVNKQNKVVRHDFKLLVAQDVGAAINGPGHVDLYTGTGYEGRKAAGRLHHYGELWLLLPNTGATTPLAMR